MGRNRCQTPHGWISPHRSVVHRNSWACMGLRCGPAGYGANQGRRTIAREQPRLYLQPLETGVDGSREMSRCRRTRVSADYTALDSAAADTLAHVLGGRTMINEGALTFWDTPAVTWVLKGVTSCGSGVSLFKRRKAVRR
jgi:hypothetical protein